MAMGTAWSPRESGVLLTTYQLDVAPQTLPVAEADSSSCSAVGRDERCTSPRMSAGTAPSMSGFTALSGDEVKDVSTSLSFGTLGDAAWTARAAILWLPTRPASGGFEVIVEAEAGTESTGTQIFR
jgi:hypothetical protein